MTFQKTGRAAFIAALFMGGTAVAQDVAEELPSLPALAAEGETDISQCLSMATAVEQALEFDPRIERAVAERDIARAGVVNTYARNKPQVSLFGQTGFGDTPPLDRRRDDQVGVQLNQELYSFGQRKFSQDQSILQYRAATYAVDESRGTITSSIALAYLDYARAVSIAGLAQEQTDTFRDEAETAEARLRRRVITLTDASQLRSRFARSRSDLVTAKEVAALALTRLEVLSNDTVSCVDEQSILEFVAPEAPRVLSMTPEHAVDEAIANSAQIQRARADVASARAGREVARRAHMPTLSLTAFYQYFAEDTTDAAGNTTTDYDDDTRVGLSISQNLYTGGQIRAQRMDASARLRAARAQENLQRLAVNDQIRRALARAKTRRMAGADLLEASEQARIQLVSTRREYERGTKTLTDLVLASDSYFIAASAEIEARYSFYSSLIELYAAMGLLGEAGLN